jgi:hypothetical protein
MSRDMLYLMCHEVVWIAAQDGGPMNQARAGSLGFITTRKSTPKQAKVGAANKPHTLDYRRLRSKCRSDT